MNEVNKEQTEEEKEKPEEIQKSDHYLRTRINPILKKKLKEIVKEKFEYSTLSNLVNDVLTDYVFGKLVPIDSIKSSEIKKGKEETLEIVKEIFETGISEIMKSNKETEKKMSLFIQSIENGFQTFPSELSNKEFNWNIEKEIIKIISVKSMTSEQLALIFEMTEHRILRFLNSMLKKETIGLNKKLEYVLVERKEDIKELNFGDD